MKESLTLRRPALVEEFLKNLMNGARMEKNSITFDSHHLNSVIQDVCLGVMRMQREAYEKWVASLHV